MADKATAPRLSDEEQQEKWLTEAKTVVDTQAKAMRAAIDKRGLQETLRHASQMLSELRTSNLSPQNYYELHVLVMNELTELEMFFHEEVAGGRNVEELYEIVQHAGFIVPRLYLLITVGSVYIKTKEAPAKDILKDLVEMCKGVQHPTRGLFLRHYLSSMMKNKLPDADNEYIGEGGTVMDSVDFVLQNLKEMVWLWVRMEQKLIIPDPERRARERKSLKVLVGLNLTCLGQLDGIDLQMYVDHVMPRVVEIIMTSKGDPIAQQYLSEVMIQVFPDEFHLAHLERLLEFLTMQLGDGVDLQSIIASLMERLARYTETDTGEKKRKWEREALKTMFDKFKSAIAGLVEEKPQALNNVKYVQTMQALLKLALKAYPADTDKVDEVFNTVAARMGGEEMDEKTVELVKRMLTMPVEHFGNMQGVLDLAGWPTLLYSLNDEARREVARDLVKHSLKSGEPLTTVEHVGKVFEFIQPLVAGEDDADYPDDEFEEDQLLVAKLVHMFQAEEGALDVQFKMLSTCRKNFGQGGEKRIKHTLPPLIFAMLKLAIKVKKANDAEIDTGKAKLEKIFNYVSGMLEVLDQAGNGRLVLNLRIQAARTADKCRQAEMAADLMDGAFLCYEEKISGDSKEQIAQLPVMISAVVSMKHYDPEQADKLSGKLCAYSSQLLRKPDQCRTVNLCSHLFQKAEEEEKQKKVMECLQRALKLVESCPESLLVEILNRYIYFFSNCNPHVMSKHVNLLVELVEAKLKEGEDEVDEATKRFYENTLKYIRTRQAKGDEGQRWQEIQLSS